MSKLFWFSLGLSLAVSEAQASWIEAYNCLVTDVRTATYFAGNLGNHNLQNVERLEFSMANCNGGKAYTGAIHAVLDPSLPTEHSGVLISPSAYQNWLVLLVGAYKARTRVNVSGEGIGSVIRKPVTLRP